MELSLLLSWAACPGDGEIIRENKNLTLSMGILFSLLGCSILSLTYFNYILVALLLSVISFQSFYYFEQSTERFFITR